MPEDERKPAAPDDEIEENTPEQEIGYAFADLLRTKEVAEAVKTWANAAAKSKQDQYPHAVLQAWLSFAFGLSIFLVIAALGWLRVLNGEVTAGLLGSLVGYWYGRHK
jgi:hypothetical protein